RRRTETEGQDDRDLPRTPQIQIGIGLRNRTDPVRGRMDAQSIGIPTGLRRLVFLPPTRDPFHQQHRGVPRTATPSTTHRLQNTSNHGSVAATAFSRRGCWSQIGPAVHYSTSRVRYRRMSRPIAAGSMNCTVPVLLVSVPSTAHWSKLLEPSTAYWSPGVPATVSCARPSASIWMELITGMTLTVR